MSIAVLTQVYDEARRLAVAGSAVAAGDFRLTKLLPALDQASAKAPVFAKVAGCARAVIDGPEETSAENLLELTSLVTAVLYTQGEIGLTGSLKPIETVDIGDTTTQTSARILKPLLEALVRTGSGRLALVKDSFEHGAFRDLRMFKPALDGLDDPYPEIADFLAENVLPLYGRAILPGLRSKYDAKGGKGDARRLKMMHAIDAAGARELVTQALDDGSKEVRVAAVECLGGSAVDLPLLVEQASAKAKDVRVAAYRALAAMDDPAAVAVLEKALAGQDLELAATAIARSKSDRLTDLLIAEVTKARAVLPKLKEKQAVSEAAGRLCALIAALPSNEHAAADNLTLDLFAGRDELAKVKGGDKSGADVVEAVIRRMAEGPEPLQLNLARNHAGLDASGLAAAFRAAERRLPPREVYDQFSPYVAADVAGRNKDKYSTWAKREAVVEALDGDNINVFDKGDRRSPVDPRWLDLAVRIKHLGLVHAVRRSGHAAALAFAMAEFRKSLKTAKVQKDILDPVLVLARLGHPGATDALITAFEKNLGTVGAYIHWYSLIVPELPKTAIPQLETFVKKLPDKLADHWISAIQTLREKE
jgi:hypothetical protein